MPPFSLPLAAVTTVALLATAAPSVGASAPAHPARAAHPTGAARPAKAASAARWQSGELVRNRIPAGYDPAKTDWGLTVDTLIALAADGHHPRRVVKVTRVLAHHVPAYTGRGSERYSGASAKLLLAAKIARRDVRSFRGHNLRRRVLALVSDAGRLRDQSKYGDFSNVFGQSYGVLGLARTGGVPDQVVHYLLRQRCTAGYFRIEEGATTCTTASGAPDVDATALALQAMITATAHGARVPGRLVRGTVAWLVRHQRDSGGFTGGAGTAGVNANSTGLAAQALAATRRAPALARAQAFLARLQLTRSRVAGTPAHGEVGAIAYDRAALRDALAHGISDSGRDQFRRSTAQALLGFAAKPLGTLLAPRP
ncbi:MAG: hypothetical protein ACR2KL_13385 [Nocardioidaceae bacterium]